ncbi:MAG TPA: aldehyde ferredoxin oxidoreductase N-terminal domain-containing protein, partial [Syntrophomonadaceae bacterium]|nr:aldehyde ferredoxin oxidoreductase N-terminal domain-containing protein [Syntrophomonadaceae bacterium]
MDKLIGKLLEINLTEQKIEQRVIPAELQKSFLGGISLNAKILFDELPPGTDPLGPDNILVFGVGTLVGTPFPTAARTEASAKSPLTGLFGTSNSGMFFGTQLIGA